MEKPLRNIKQIVEYIRVVREQKEYTQEYLAAKLAISQNAYSKLELGYCKLSVQRLLDIAVILEVDVVELLEQSTIPTPVAAKGNSFQEPIAAYC